MILELISQAENFFVLEYD